MLWSRNGAVTERRWAKGHEQAMTRLSNDAYYDPTDRYVNMLKGKHNNSAGGTQMREVCALSPQEILALCEPVELRLTIRRIANWRDPDANDGRGYTEEEKKELKKAPPKVFEDMVSEVFLNLTF